MKRKKTALLLTFVLTFLCACSGQNTKEETSSISSTPSDQQVSEKTDSESTGKSTGNRLDFGVEKQVLIDASGIKITATGLELNENTDNYSLFLTVDNNTDQNLTIGFRDTNLSLAIGAGSYTYLNGYQVSGNGSIFVPAQSSVEDCCFLNKAALDEAGIRQIGEIELAFSAIDSDHNNVLDAAQSVCTFQTTLTGEMDTQLDKQMNLLYDKKGIQIYSKYVSPENSDDKGHLITAIRNNTKEGHQFRIERIAVDGTPLTYSNTWGDFEHIIGGLYYENPGKTVCFQTSFATVDNVSKITDDSVITFTVTIGGDGSADGSDAWSTETITVP